MKWLALHGLLGAERQFNPLVDERTTIHAPSICGHGNAPLCSSFDEELERYAKFSDADHLVGYSQGGRLALSLAARYWPRFKRIVIIGAHPGYSESEQAERKKLDEKWASELERDGMECFVDRWEEMPIFTSQKKNLTADQFAEQRKIRLEHSAASIAHSIRLLGAGSWPRPELESIEAKVDIIVGEQDQKYVDLWKANIHRLKKGRLHIAPRSAHNVLLERPDVISAIMRNEQSENLS